MRSWRVGISGVVFAAILVMGCGAGSTSGSSTGAATGGTAAPGNYLPLAVGMTWTYNVTSTSGATGQGTIVVESAENAPMSGQSAFRVHTTLLDGGTLSWEQTSGPSVVRYEEQQLSQTGSVVDDKQYTPPILVLDESAPHLVAGATWTESYMEMKMTASKTKNTQEQAVWTVQSVDDSITVPAGTYTCIRIDRNHTTSKTPSDQVEWYAVGVGKIKETGAGQNNDQTLELASAPMQ